MWFFGWVEWLYLYQLRSCGREHNTFMDVVLGLYTCSRETCCQPHGLTVWYWILHLPLAFDNLVIVWLTNILGLICKIEMSMVLEGKGDCRFPLWRFMGQTNIRLMEGKIHRFITTTEQHMKEKWVALTQWDLEGDTLSSQGEGKVEGLGGGVGWMNRPSEEEMTAYYKVCLDLLTLPHLRQIRWAQRSCCLHLLLPRCPQLNILGKSQEHILGCHFLNSSSFYLMGLFQGVPSLIGVRGVNP